MFFGLRTASVRSVRHLRSPHTLSRLYQSQVPLPEHAPGQTENEAWLDGLDDTKDDGFSYIQELPDPELALKNKHNKTDYELVEFNEDGSMQVSLTFNNSSLRSSPYSNLSSKQRPKAESNKQSFSDLRVIRLRSGKGGNGHVSFFRDAGRSVGPPNGGDGGRGGSIYVQAIEGITSLNKLNQFYRAGDGESGKQRQLDGGTGKDVLITVPVGTLIKWSPDPALIRESEDNQVKVEVKTRGAYRGDTKPKFIQMLRDSYGVGEGWHFKDKDKDEEWHRDKPYFEKLDYKVKKYDHTIINSERNDDLFPLHGIDLTRPSEKPILLLKGGAGGLGNMHFLTNEVRNPRFAKVGRNYIEGHFLFELKLLADLGLVGLPNAGKSTLLRAISNARPRVGHWEFTTLQPTIGTISLGLDKPAFTVADIPGLIKGATQNKGMGIDFLRHVERSGGLVFVISLGNEDPIKDLETLLGETNHIIEGKKVLIAATKADLPDTHEKFKLLRDYVNARNWKIVPISGMKQENIEQLILMMGECAGKL